MAHTVQHSLAVSILASVRQGCLITELRQNSNERKPGSLQEPGVVHLSRDYTWRATIAE